MLKRLRTFVLVKQFYYYGKKADHYRAKMKECEIGGDEFVHWFYKVYAALDRRVKVLDKLYAMR